MAFNQLSPMDRDYSRDWINHILTADSHNYHFMDYTPELAAIQPEMIELLMNLCTRFNLTTDIEFSCFDTFDYFISCTFELMQSRLDNLEARGQVNPGFGWIYVKEEFLANYDQCVLCIVSLVTKYFDVGQFKSSCIQRVWQKVSKGEIASVSLAKKEAEILKIIKFKIRKSQALESIEMFLVVCVEPFLPSNIQDVYFLSLKILRIVYLNRTSIYSPLKPLLRKTPTNQFHFIQTDKVLMGAAVVLASVKFLQVHIEDELRKSIANLTKLTPNDLKVLSKEMYKVSKSILSETAIMEIN